MYVSCSVGLSKGVGFIRFDQRIEAELAIQKLNGTIPEGAAEPITVKFANNPSNNNKAVPPLAAYLSPLTRRYGGPIHHPAGRFRYIPLSPLTRCVCVAEDAPPSAIRLNPSPFIHHSPSKSHAFHYAFHPHDCLF